MPITPHDLSYFKFTDFNASHINRFLNMLHNSSFTESDSWVHLPRFEAGLSKVLNDDTVNTRYAILSGDTVDGTHVEFFIGQFTIWVKNNNESSLTPQVITKMFVDVKLPFSVPHIRVLPQGSTLPAFISTSSNSSSVSLEGDFNKFFTVLTTKGNEVAAYQALPPDTMIHLLTKVPDVSIEYEEDHIFITIPLQQTFGVSSYVGLNGEVVTGKMVFNDTWLSFYDKLFTVFGAVPELVDSAKIARIPNENFVPLNNEWVFMNKKFSNKVVKNTIALILFSVIILLFAPLLGNSEGAMSLVGNLLSLTPIFVVVCTGGLIYFIVDSVLFKPKRRKRLLKESGY